MSCSSWPPSYVSFSLPLRYFESALPDIHLITRAKHIGVNFTRIIKAFIIFKNEPGGPAAFFNELSEFTQIFGSTIYIGQTLIGDGVAVCIILATDYLIFLSYGVRRLIGFADV